MQPAFVFDVSEYFPLASVNTTEYPSEMATFARPFFPSVTLPVIVSTVPSGESAFALSAIKALPVKSPTLCIKFLLFMFCIKSKPVFSTPACR